MFDHLPRKRRTILKGLVTLGVTAFAAPFIYAANKYLAFMDRTLARVPIPPGASAGASGANGASGPGAASAPIDAESATVPLSVLNGPAASERVDIGDEPVLVVKESNNQIRAFTATCTHRGCIVRFRPQQQDFFCKCHNGLFDRNGVNVPGTRPKKPLTELIVQEQGQNVQVYLAPKANG